MSGATDGGGVAADEDPLPVDHVAERAVTTSGRFARSIIAFAAMCGALLLLFALASWSGLPSGTYSFVVTPPDEPLTVIADPPTDAQPPMTVASTTGTLASMAMTLPGAVGAGRLLQAASAMGVDPLTTRVLRTTSTAAREDGSLSPYITVGMLLDTGYHEVLGMTPDGEVLWYEPALVQFPESADAGALWGSSGQTVGAAPFTFLGLVTGATARTGPIGPVQDTSGCIDVQTRLDQQIPGSRGYLVERITTWCPGWGSVASTSTGDGVRTRLATLAEVAWPEAATTRSSTREPGTSLSLPIPVVSVLIPPVTTAAGMVMANGWVGDLVGVGIPAADESAASSTVRWLQRAGGSIVGLAADQDRVYATSSLRGLLAFDDAGRLRWSASLPDVAVGSPVVLDGTIAVALLDGTLRGYEAGTGRTLWTERLTDVPLHGPVVAGDAVVAADSGGYAVAVGPGGDPRWSTSLETVDGPLTALADGGVVLPQADGAVTLISGEGEPVWTHYLSDGNVSAAGAQWGDVIALPTSAGLLGMDAATGEVRWTAAALADARVAPDGVATLPTAAYAVSSDGSLTRLVEFREADGTDPLDAFPARVAGVPVVVTRGGSITFLGASDG